MSIIRTAPKHRASHPKSVTLRLLDDIIPLATTDRSMTKSEALAATGGDLPQGYRDTSPDPATMARRDIGRGMRDRVDHGTYIQYRQARNQNAPAKSRGTGIPTKSAKRAPTVDVAAVLATIGYDGPITPHIRNAVRDAMAHRDQINQYCAS